MRRPLAVLSLCLMSVACARSVFAAFDFADGETGARIVQKDDTAAVFEIQLSGDEAWTATTDVPSTDGGWINLRRKQGTDCSRPATYKVLHNYSTDVRVGHIYVNGLTYTVTQLGYGAALSPSGNVSIPAAGTIAEGQISFSIEPATDGASEIAWTAASDSDWVAVRPSRGDGDSMVYYSVGENTSESERIATLTIAGQQILLTQSGAEIVDPNANKVWLVPETAITWSCPAKEFDVSLVTGNDVNWTAASDAEWIVITTSKTGTGSSVMHVSLPENRSVLSRSGKITVNNAELTVIQRGTTDFELSLDPQTSSFSYGGAISNVSVSASQDMSWTAKSSMSWVKFTPGSTSYTSGAGPGNVRYVVSANPTLTNRTAEIEVSAQIPYPEIDIARGLTQWKNENWLKWTAFNDPSVRDADVQGCTEGVWFRVNETNALNRLFDLNNGAAALYVQEFQNRLVYDAPDGNIVDLGFSVATNVTYDLFLVTMPTTTAIYGGIHDSGVYRHLYTDNRSLRITNYKHTTKPSEDGLVKGDASKHAYYFWNRPLTETELLNFPSEAPRIPAASGDVYSTLYSHAPMDRFRVRKSDGTEETLAVSNVIASSDRYGLGQNSLSGFYIQPYKEICLIATNGWDAEVYGYYYFANCLMDIRGGVGQSLQHAVKTTDIARSMDMTYNIWFKADELDAVQRNFFSVLRLSTKVHQTKWYNENSSRYWYRYVDVYKVAQLDKALDSYGITVSSNGFCFVEDSTSSVPFGEHDFSGGGWHMLTVTSNGSKMTMYLDGKDIGTKALAGGYDGFGLDSWCAYGNGGKIVFDDIKTFTSCLTTDQINEIYNLEKPLKRTLTITQGIAPATLSDTNIECSSKITSKTVSLSLPAPNIAWTAEPQVDWITPSPASGTGSAEITLTIAKNPETSDRTGVIVIGGIPVTIHQRRAGIAVPYDVIVADYDGETMYVPIDADDDETHWIVEDYPDDWMYVIDEDGYGSMDMEFDVDEMGQGVSLSARVGAITVSGQKFYVVQRDYVPEIEPYAVTSRWNTAGGSIQVTTGYGIEYWEAVSDSDWITITQGDSGVGSGAVSYTLAENDTGKDRVGRIIIAGEVCFITQRRPPVLTGLEIAGADSLLAGDTANYSARLIYSDGTSVLAESVAWTVADSTVATVDAQGAVTAGNSAGNVVLSASCTADGKEWSAPKQIEVLAKPTALSVEVDQELICPGWTVEVVFTVTYADGTTKKLLPSAITVIIEGDATLDEDGFLTIGSTSGQVRIHARYSENDSGLLGTDKTIDVREPISVNEAIGDNSLTYLSGGNASWQVDPWRSHDETFAVQSGQIQSGQTSDIKTVVGNAGTISFWVKTSTAESADDAAFRFVVDGVVVVELSGMTDWTNIVHEITGNNEHELIWRYAKGAAAGHVNEDAVWIDDVVWREVRTYYANATDGNDAADGLSKAAAVASLQTAIDRATNGDTIIVADGMYAPIHVGDKRITIESENGYKTTIIDGGGTDRCASFWHVGTYYWEQFASTNAMLRGFTLRNGRASEGAGALGGTLERCLIVCNVACNEETPQGLLPGQGGVAHGSMLRYCTVVGNAAEAFAGYDGAVAQCGGVYGCTLENCIVYGNEGVIAPNAVDSDYSSDSLVGVDPLFVNAANGDYRLVFDSPCVVAGVVVAGCETEIVDPVPPVTADAEVASALYGSADANLAANLTSKNEYNAYRAWVDRHGIGHQSAKDAAKSWLSYALDASVLIDKRFRKGDLSIDLFAPYSAGGFLFELGLNGVDIGDEATAANLAKVFGVEGATSLDSNDFSSDNVTLSFGVPNDGKATIVAEPKDGNAASFFLRATMRDFYDDVPVVSLSLNGGGSLNGASDEILVDRDAEYGTLPTPTRTGHTFDGWYTKATGGTKVTGSTTITTNSSHALYAHWMPNAYTVTFNPNGGSCSTESKIVTYGASYGTLPTPVQVGMTFEGWFTLQNDGDQILSTDTFRTLADIVVYAHWTTATYTLTFNANGGSVTPTTKMVAYGSPYGELPIPTRSDIYAQDYAFTGWRTIDGSAIEDYKIVEIQQSQVLYANWVKCHYDLRDDRAILTWCQESGDFFIPAKVDGHPVVGIESAFSGQSSLTSVAMPNTITTIGPYAFCDCRNLTNITISASVTSIGSDAFLGCTNLTSVLIPACVTNIGYSAFEDCSSLSGLVIPDGIADIGDRVFLRCRNLTAVDIPNSVTNIGSYAFCACDRLMSVTMPNGLMCIGDRAFCSCGELTGALAVPDSVTSIGELAFYGCTNLDSVTIGNGVTNIGHNAFGGCSGLTSVTISNCVANIGQYAFAGCSGLTSVMISNCVANIGYSAFNGCLGLSSVIIGSGVTNIDDSAFYGCSRLANMTIPDSVTSIGNNAFSGCSGLTRVSIPDSVTRIGSSSFSGCSGLTSVTIPDSVKSIGPFAFKDCSNLTHAYVPSALRSSMSSYYGVFEGCPADLVITYY